MPLDEQRVVESCETGVDPGRACYDDRDAPVRSASDTPRAPERAPENVASPKKTDMSQAVEQTGQALERTSSPVLRLTYSPEHGLLYLAFGDGDVADAIEVEESVYLDVSSDGRPLGIEFLNGRDLPAFLSRCGGEFVVPARVESVDNLTTTPATP
jgi:uncharacterized protein YuzE